MRRDITSSFGIASGRADGVPARIKLTLLDTAKRCAPMAGAAVYVWHCDREGRYSLYSDGVTDGELPPRRPGSRRRRRRHVRQHLPRLLLGPVAAHPLRGLLRSRRPRPAAGNTVATSQVALPADVCNTVFATDGYEQSVQNVARTSLQSDNVFGDDGGVHELATVTGSVEQGYVVALDVGV